MINHLDPQQVRARRRSTEPHPKHDWVLDLPCYLLITALIILTLFL